MTVSPMALPPKTEAISARIIPWDHDVGIGVAYGFQGGKHRGDPRSSPRASPRDHSDYDRTTAEYDD
jgi:hypothetical protein